MHSFRHQINFCLRIASPQSLYNIIGVSHPSESCNKIKYELQVFFSFTNEKANEKEDTENVVWRCYATSFAFEIHIIKIRVKIQFANLESFDMCENLLTRFSSLLWISNAHLFITIFWKHSKSIRQERFSLFLRLTSIRIQPH